jgi:predicted SnoaL-like aldol condensation-catalyzing enzyme
MDSFNKGTKQEGHWYYTGAYATIRMVAAQGHDGFVRFMKSVAETSNANQSFEKIYGIKFEDFAKIVAPEISALAKTIKSR